MAKPVATVEVSPQGIVHVSLKKALAEVCVWLDGQAVSTIRPVAGDDGRRHAAYALPRDRVFSELDIRDPAGIRLIGACLPLATTYRLAAHSISLRGWSVVAAFTGAEWLAPTLGVTLSEGSEVFGRGQAMRERDGVWRATIRLSRLVDAQRPVTLYLSVTDHVLSSPVRLTASEMGVIGEVERAAPDRVSGWVKDIVSPERRCEVKICVDGVERLRCIPDLPHALGHGFDVRLPDSGGAQQEITVALAESGVHLSGSPALVRREQSIVGSFDAVHGLAAHGWVLDRDNPARPMTVEAITGRGEIVGRAEAKHFRGDLLDAGLNRGYCAFFLDLTPHAQSLRDAEIWLRIAGTNFLLPGSPRRFSPNPNIVKFLSRRRALRPEVLRRLRHRLNKASGDFGISIIMPVFNPDVRHLQQALRSVDEQFCDAWELLCIDDGSTHGQIPQILQSAAERDNRIRYIRRNGNAGIASAVNAGLEAARLSHVAFLDQDDILEPDAVWQMIRAARSSGAELLYSDEAITEDDIDCIREFRLRPAFSHDYYLSHPYFVHWIAVERVLAQRLRWDESMAISADVDFVLRAIEQARYVAHVPAVLYRWRTHEQSAGHAKKAQVMQATGKALQRHLDRSNLPGRVRQGLGFNQFRVDWPRPSGDILVVIPTKNRVDLLRRTVDSLETHAGGDRFRICIVDHASDDFSTRAYLRSLQGRHSIMPYRGAFNFSRMNNRAVKEFGAGAEFLLFLNNDVEALQDGWIGRLASLTARRDVGVVGPLLIYPDRSVQHAGVILGFNRSADHAMKFQPAYERNGQRALGYNCSLVATRDFSAVTAACMMVRRDTFDGLAGFDERFAIGFNDTDFCLRVRERGLKILYDGSTVLVHHESGTRSHTGQVFHPSDTARMVKRWGHVLEGGDPFYHPNLASTTQDHVPREDAGCRVINDTRVMPGLRVNNCRKRRLSRSDDPSSKLPVTRRGGGAAFG